MIPCRAVMRAAPLCLALAIGCASPSRLYVNSEADMAFYEKVAVIPFTNLSGQAYAGERVTRAFVTELVIAEHFTIVDPGEFRAVLERTGALPSGEGTYDPRKLKAAATEVGATGMVRGAVTEYEMQRGSSGSDTPILAFEVELVDVATGTIVWRSSMSKRGKGRTPVIGGGGTRTLSRLTQEACRELVDRIGSEAY